MQNAPKASNRLFGTGTLAGSTGDATVKKLICGLAIAILVGSPILRAQDQSAGTPAAPPNPFDKGIDLIFNYLNMAGTRKAAEFKPMTEEERFHLYLRSMKNPIGFLKAGFSAGINQLDEKPEEWGQGASGYGKRYGDILGQYVIQRTVTFGLSSVLHEDNRYFNSGKSGFWPRAGYAVESGILARHDDGSRHISISYLGGVAAGAFLSRLWQPPSQSSAQNGAISFGITTASNMGFGVVKEFLPDLGRAIAKKRQKSSTQAPSP